MTNEKVTYLGRENGYFENGLGGMGQLELFLWKLQFGIHPVDFPTGPVKNKNSNFKQKNLKIFKKNLLSFLKLYSFYKT